LNRSNGFFISPTVSYISSSPSAALDGRRPLPDHLRQGANHPS
jgi:hypothetical protein